MHRSAMPANIRSGASFDDHDAPAMRAIHAIARQAVRTQRAETARKRQRAALLDLLAQTMAEMHISMPELNAARRVFELRGRQGAGAPE